MTGTAKLRIDDALARGVLFHLAGAAAGSHTEVFHRTAKARELMSLKVCKADDDVGVHDGAADLCRLADLSVLDGNLNVVRALETIADDDLTARRRRIEAVEIRAVHMLERVLAAAGIERVAVDEEGIASLFLDDVRDNLRILWAQESKVAKFTEVHLDGDELSFHIDFAQPRRHAELLEFHEKTLTERGAEVREVNFRFFHIALLKSDFSYRPRLLMPRLPPL